MDSDGGNLFSVILMEFECISKHATTPFYRMKIDRYIQKKARLTPAALGLMALRFIWHFRELSL